MSAERLKASKWRESTTTIPDEHRSPGDYRKWKGLSFCLTPEARVFNLLPSARDLALPRFSAAGIPWHDGSDGLPSNHLLSSQVQCVNALSSFVGRPDALAEMFRGVLDVSEVLPFAGTGAAATPYDWADHVVFEWPGAIDYLGERSGSPNLRGANTTSVDAAIRYRTSDEAIEIALIEWKYTETYRGKTLSGGSTRNEKRRSRYQPWWSHHGPVIDDGQGIDGILVEPLYQLFRLQCLAQEMTKAGEGGAASVSVVYAAPRGNSDLLDHYPDPDGNTLAGQEGALLATWRRRLRHENLLCYFDTESLLEPGSAVSDEYRSRYGVS